MVLWGSNVRCVNTLKTFYRASPPKMRNLMRFCYEEISRLVGILFRGAAIKKLRENSAKYKYRTIDDHIDLAFSFGFGPFNIRPSQIRWEISQLMQILAKLAPRTVLEIGTANGGTFYLLTKVASPDATLISIDLPGGPFGGGYHAWKVPFYRSFGSAGQKIHLLRMDSHDETTLREVERILGGLKVDFLFIDGDHSYEGVKQDFQMYRKLVKPGGIVTFHDIVPGPPENVGGVPNFWSEIKQEFRYLEIVEDWNQGGYGIGVIYIE